MDKSALTDLINNIDSGTLADAEQVFNDIMDLKAGEALDSYRQQVAASMFGSENSYEDEESDYEDSDDEDSLEDFSGEEDDA